MIRENEGEGKVGTGEERRTQGGRGRERDIYRERENG